MAGNGHGNDDDHEERGGKSVKVGIEYEFSADAMLTEADGVSRPVTLTGSVRLTYRPAATETPTLTK